MSGFARGAMENQKGIWVNKSVSTPYGEVIISMRLDTAINPEVMLSKLEKEKDLLIKQMNKLVDKLNSLNDKTPQKIMDGVINELIENQKLHIHCMNEYLRWSEALRQKIIEDAVIEASK